MKKATIILIMILMSFSTLMGQTNENNSFFTDIKLAYNFASKYHTTHTSNYPYGISLASSIGINQRFRTNIGICFKTQKKVSYEAPFHSDPISHTNVIRNQHKYNYLDIPVHLQYGIIQSERFNLHLSTGVMPSFLLYKEDWTPYMDGKEYHLQDYAFNIAAQVGLMETFHISDHFSIFASQDIGHYLFSPAIHAQESVYYHDNGRNTVDLKLGVIYRL